MRPAELTPVHDQRFTAKAQGVTTFMSECKEANFQRLILFTYRLPCVDSPVMHLIHLYDDMVILDHDVSTEQPIISQVVGGVLDPQICEDLRHLQLMLGVAAGMHRLGKGLHET